MVCFNMWQAGTPIIALSFWSFKIFVLAYELQNLLILLPEGQVKIVN